MKYIKEVMFNQMMILRNMSNVPMEYYVIAFGMDSFIDFLIILAL